MGEDLITGKIKFMPTLEELRLEYLHERIDSLDKKLAQVILQLEIIASVIEKNGCDSKLFRAGSVQEKLDGIL